MIWRALGAAHDVAVTGRPAQPVGGSIGPAYAAHKGKRLAFSLTAAHDGPAFRGEALPGDDRAA
ncbi:hypothetical protein [Caulobacter sp. FWC26]|uniref:hypothetical protein n=1 Tax=Caulobacter sp. FWC26 TaxID=69665 RepID=UPI000C1572CE|nr:hypothetical protein [Caulobacter sp. FWC26]AZS22297.1 hypothetical protein CSW63_17610 [Caulobacter sp. FWC26]